MDDQNTEELAVWVFDEGQVVTYRWLSLLLGITSSQAQEKLLRFHDQYRNKVEITYCICGNKKIEEELRNTLFEYF